MVAANTINSGCFSRECSSFSCGSINLRNWSDQSCPAICAPRSLSTALSGSLGRGGPPPIGTGVGPPENPPRPPGRAPAPLNPPPRGVTGDGAPGAAGRVLHRNPQTAGHGLRTVRQKLLLQRSLQFLVLLHVGPLVEEHLGAAVQGIGQQQEFGGRVLLVEPRGACSACPPANLPRNPSEPDCLTISNALVSKSLAGHGPSCSLERRSLAAVTARNNKASPCSLGWTSRVLSVASTATLLSSVANVPASTCSSVLSAKPLPLQPNASMMVSTNFVRSAGLYGCEPSGFGLGGGPYAGGAPGDPPTLGGILPRGVNCGPGGVAGAERRSGRGCRARFLRRQRLQQIDQTLGRLFVAAILLAQADNRLQQLRMVAAASDFVIRGLPFGHVIGHQWLLVLLRLPLVAVRRRSLPRRWLSWRHRLTRKPVMSAGRESAARGRRSRHALRCDRLLARAGLASAGAASVATLPIGTVEAREAAGPAARQPASATAPRSVSQGFLRRTCQTPSRGRAGSPAPPLRPLSRSLASDSAGTTTFFSILPPGDAAPPVSPG